MKVLVSTPGIFHAFQLANQLQKRDYLDRIITGYPKFLLSKWRLNVKKEKIESVPIQVLRHPFSAIGLDKNIIKYLLAEIFDKCVSKKIGEVDIFVGFSGFSLHSIKKAKKKKIITVLERGSSHVLYQKKILEEEYEKFGIKKEVIDKRIVEKELKEYEIVDYISVPSEFVKRSFIEYGVDESKIIKVPYGADIKVFKQLPKKDDVFRIIFVGGLCFDKGLFYLLEAFKQLKLPNSELVVIGKIRDPNIKFLLKKYANYFTYIPHVSHNELYKFYSNSSVFVLPSIQEGLALVILEAMSCGLPVIISENTGGGDIVKNGVNGFVVPIRNIEAIKEKIKFFYYNEEKRRKFGERAREYVKKGFTWDDYGKKMIENYIKIIEKRK